MKILIATDGSVHSKAAIEEIARRPFPPNTQVRLVTVYERTFLITPMGPIDMSLEHIAAVEQNALKMAENITTKAAKILHKKNPTLTITTIVIEGTPKSVILEEAEKFGANLIVVGSHGCGVVERLLLGSVSHAISLHAKCSVFIVRK